jgi:hypothetical protein
MKNMDNMSDVKQVLLPEPVLQQVMNYLAEQKHKEVNHLIVAIQSTSKIVDVKKVEPVEDEKENTDTDEAK